MNARAGGDVEELAGDEPARLRLDPDGPFMPVAGRGAVGGGRGHVRSPAVGFRPAGGPRGRRGQRCTPRPGETCYVITLPRPRRLLKTTPRPPPPGPTPPSTG